ncbi:hypothetical protein CEXT_12891 [Caerostris extrusa]|uniref:Uncharacterized protein n=1 Tax=Caerostris extrusa TaxID=172846 RepID=A0AAV4XHN4_CAEEX|nr:hypothetical protein CEXT_12891 [Caerostris extrusa]
MWQKHYQLSLTHFIPARVLQRSIPFPVPLPIKRALKEFASIDGEEQQRAINIYILLESAGEAYLLHSSAEAASISAATICIGCEIGNEIQPSFTRHRKAISKFHFPWPRVKE